GMTASEIFGLRRRDITFNSFDSLRCNSKCWSLDGANTNIGATLESSPGCGLRGQTAANGAYLGTQRARRAYFQSAARLEVPQSSIQSPRYGGLARGDGKARDF